MLGEEKELAVVCGGFFLRTEVRADDVSLVACCMLLRLKRRRIVPVRSIATGEGGGEVAVAVAVIEEARVAVVSAGVVLASAAQGLAADIWRHGSALSLTLTPRLAAITANRCVGSGGNGAAMRQAIMCPSKCPSKEDEVRQVGGRLCGAVGWS